MAEVKHLHHELHCESLSSGVDVEGTASKGGTMAGLSAADAITRLDQLAAMTVSIGLMKESGIGTLLSDIGRTVRTSRGSGEYACVADAAKRVIDAWKAHLKSAVAAV